MEQQSAGNNGERRRASREPRSAFREVSRDPVTRVPADPPRGELTTKIHLAADGDCRPLAFVLTAGQAGDAPAFTDVMARLRVPRRRGRPRTRPEVVLADKAYSPRAIRDYHAGRAA